MGIVDHAENRLLLGSRGEQAERPRADQEPCVERRPEPECSSERVGLAVRYLLEEVEERAEELMEARERQLGFRLDATRVQHPHPLCALLCEMKESALADARLAAQHECSA